MDKFTDMLATKMAAKKPLAITDGSIEEVHTLAAKQYEKEHVDELREAAMTKIIREQLSDIEDAKPKIMRLVAKIYTQEHENIVAKKAATKYTAEHKDSNDFMDKVIEEAINDDKFIKACADKWLMSNEPDEAMRANIEANVQENKHVEIIDEFVDRKEDDPKFLEDNHDDIISELVDRKKDDTMFLDDNSNDIIKELVNTGIDQEWMDDNRDDIIKELVKCKKNDPQWIATYSGEISDKIKKRKSK